MSKNKLDIHNLPSTTRLYTEKENNWPEKLEECLLAALPDKQTEKENNSRIHKQVYGNVLSQSKYKARHLS